MYRVRNPSPKNFLAQIALSVADRIGSSSVPATNANRHATYTSARQAVDRTLDLGENKKVKSKKQVGKRKISRGFAEVCFI